MSCLPHHGRIECNLCHVGQSVTFDKTRTTDGDWRITSNPLAWGSRTPRAVVLGFSKGPSQAGALSVSPHDAIAFKGGRTNIGKIMAHVGLIHKRPPHEYASYVDHLISNPDGEFHFGSLVRCTVERRDRETGGWKGSGGGMLDKFVATSFGRTITSNCAQRFLRDLPSSVKVVLMFGLGTKMNYVKECRKIFDHVRPGAWRTVNSCAYTDGSITVVHVEHFAAQGALIPNWLGENAHKRAELGLEARAAVEGVPSGPQSASPRG